LPIFLNVGRLPLAAANDRTERHTTECWLPMTIEHRSFLSFRRGLNRRRFLKRTVAIGAVLPLVTRIGRYPARAQSKTINVASFGGVVQEYQTRLFARPFEAKTGIKVNIGPNASLALAKLQNSSGAPAQWDIISLSGAEYFEAVSQNLIAPYDYNIIDPTYIPPEYRESHGVKFALFLFVMAWDKRQIPDDKAPQSPAEFWDTNRYKGKRSLYSGISGGGTLEMAVLADGGSLNQLYPLDVDRALRSLERLGRGNIIWHGTNAEPIQQLSSGAVPLANCFNGRVVSANRSGAQLGYTPAYSGVMGNPYCVMQTSANKKEAFEYINYMLNTIKAAAEYMELTNYAVPNTEALKLVSPDIVDVLPTSPKLKDKVYIKDDAWWAANLARVTAKFKEWQLAG
jgi:putative spermidine/putrescine transport system substrate-binding protein